jgi:hypothetical protein
MAVGMGTAVPHFGQNLAPASRFVPQELQKAIAITSARYTHRRTEYIANLQLGDEVDLRIPCEFVAINAALHHY